MASLYTPESLGVKPPSGGFQQGAWYSGRQYWGGTLSDPGVIHPSSNQSGAGQSVSQEVNNQSAQAQGVSSQQFNNYLTQQTQQSANVKPTGTAQPQQQQQQAQQPQQTGQMASTMASIPAQPTIDLTKIYQNLYSSSGISDLESKLSEQDKAYVEAKGKLNDNPFLSEATRVGRVAKIEQLYNERTANLRGDIATKKADVETQLNLQTKQFDLNNEMVKQSWDQFNSLLSMGALNGASGEDIANITRSTGISSDMIYSAINANKKKDTKTQLIQVDDGTNVNAVLVNSDTGEIINQSVLGKSKPKEYAPKAEKEVKPTEAVSEIIRSYISNPQQQAQVSPEDLIDLLVLQYGEDNVAWDAEKIRQKTGQ